MRAALGGRAWYKFGAVQRFAGSEAGRRARGVYKRYGAAGSDTIAARCTRCDAVRSELAVRLDVGDVESNCVMNAGGAVCGKGTS